MKENNVHPTQLLALAVNVGGAVVAPATSFPMTEAEALRILAQPGMPNFSDFSFQYVEDDLLSALMCETIKRPHCTYDFDPDAVEDALSDGFTEEEIEYFRLRWRAAHCVMNAKLRAYLKTWEDTIHPSELLGGPALAPTVFGATPTTGTRLSIDPWSLPLLVDEEEVFEVSASVVESDLLGFLQQGVIPVFWWDTPQGKANLEKEAAEGDVKPEEETEQERAEWLEAHSRLRQKLRIYLKETTPPAPPIDLTGNLCAKPAAYSKDVSEVEHDMLDAIQNGTTPICHYDSEAGEKERSSDPDYTPELEAEYRRQWQEAHCSLNQKLRAYLERFPCP